MQAIGIGRPGRQDTIDLRDALHVDDNSNVHAHVEATHTYPSDEEHSVIEDDSDADDRELDYGDDDDDGSSSLSIPNESIDFDLVYSLHSFAATVEGQANVVKGDSLFLMDDSNSYWWLVRVLKTQEVGYIPAENIETPFERLARLNKHRNVDLASATQAELQEGVDRLRNNIVSSRTGQNTPSPIPHKTPGPRPGQDRGVIFTPALYVHRYPPAVWGEYDEDEDDAEWDDEPYEDEDPDLADDDWYQRKDAENAAALGMEPDDGMGWDDSVVEDLQARSQPLAPGQAGVPLALQAGQRQNATGQAPAPALRQPTSREGLAAQAAGKASPPTSPGKFMDPAEVTGTRKVSATPSIARDGEAASSGPLLPSAIMQNQEDDRKRTREEIEALEEGARKKAKAGVQKPAPVAAAPVASKLRKEQSDEDTGKKKKGGLFSGLFGGKKDKAKSAGVSSTDGGSIELGRASSESGRSSSLHGAGSSNQHGTAESGSSTATTTQQQQTMVSSMRIATTPKREQPQQQGDLAQGQGPQTPPQQISSHASQLRQRDQQQQDLYKQYLTHSPASPPEASPNYGLQTASAVMSGASSYNSSANSAIGLGLPGTRQRPVSLILQGPAADAQGVGVPDLSVIRVFAGHNLQTEATFKTVLLNSSTTSSDLIRQAMQRFRLPAGEDENDYYLAVKQLEGSAAVLLASEHPLGVFETLVEAAMELPKVKRSSVGSISSVASNLSMHPAIKKLPMNDFTDDSAVKFYLNRKADHSSSGSIMGEDGDETLMADTTADSVSSSSQYLSVNNNPNNINADRFNSPSFRFALQLAIYADDLPEDMVFDPVTEAIVFKNTLRDRAPSNASPSSKISSTMRRKVFMFPKNVTVAEVIEVGLERFGIAEGVVDGGDEVEDKMTKRRSSARVRYGLTVDIGIQERELSPSSKVVDAYPTPPVYRAAERRLSDTKRRSVDSAQLLGNCDDVNPEDPTFILRRAVSYRSSTSRHRLSAPLDELALSRMQMQRDSVSSSSVNSDGTADDAKPKQLSRQELIAAQRAASRANQKSVLSAQTNSVRGVDVLLPGNTMIRSSRYDAGAGDRMRYSYVEPDGETYDISDIVEEEWQGNADANKNDLLEGVLGRSKDGLGDNFDRVLNKIKNGKAARAAMSRSTSQLTDRDMTRSTSPSEYDTDTGENDKSRSATPNARTPTPTSGAAYNHARSGSAGSKNLTVNTQDTRRAKSNTPNHSKPRGPERNASIASVMSDLSGGYATSAGGYVTPLSHMPGETPEGSPRSVATATPQNLRRPFLPKDDFGIDYMMNIINLRATLPRAPTPPPLDHVDELLFGRKLQLDSVHPQLRDVYAGSFKQIEVMDKTLDEFLQHTMSAT